MLSNRPFQAARSYPLIACLLCVALPSIAQAKESAPFELKTRGVGGTRVRPSSLESEDNKVTGVDGAVVEEIWFRHAAP